MIIDQWSGREVQSASVDQRTLRNGVPVALVEDLLDLVASIEKASNFDENVDLCELLDHEVRFDDVGYSSNAAVEERECLLAMAVGDVDAAKNALDRMRSCVRGYFKEMK